MLIREAASHYDLDQACVIQREVWDIEDLEIVGRIQLKASQHVGGSVLVAESADGTMAGIAYAFPAYLRGEVFWHSDLLAVRPRFRGTGIGRDLKWAQRDHALRSGVKRITWTFDPMQSGNAHLNLELLGVTVGEYLSNFYGVTTSALHHGLPTDRLLASWDLESPRVVARAHGERGPFVEGREQVAIPRAWNELVEREPERAVSEQRRVRTGLSAAFARGLVIDGFDKPSCAYLLNANEPGTK